MDVTRLKCKEENIIKDKIIKLRRYGLIMAHLQITDKDLGSRDKIDSI